MNAQRNIIVIGTASGGFTALCKLLEGLAATVDVTVLAAFDSGSLPAASVLQVLGHQSHLKVSYAHDGMVVQQGQLILSPMAQSMQIVEPGVIELVALTSRPVDLLFETAAGVYGNRVIAIVLTGGVRDGARGLIAVEAAHGVGVVQDPADALAETMPRSAIRGDHPNYCTRMEDMPKLLASLVR
ncbi:chemotaxis protein CheB [Variovorax sp. H27-G14]